MFAARTELGGLAIQIMQIGPLKAILESFKIRKFSTQLQVSQEFGLDVYSLDPLWAGPYTTARKGFV